MTSNSSADVIIFYRKLFVMALLAAVLLYSIIGKESLLFPRRITMRISYSKSDYGCNLSENNAH